MKKSFELPKEFGEKWVTALRSGNYTQGEGMLLSMEFDYESDYDHDPIEGTESYCCLGVAGKICDIEEEDLLLVELFTYEPEKFIKLGIPEVLTQTKSILKSDSEDDSMNVVDCLTSLNDGLSESVREELIRTFPNITFRKPHENVLTKFNFNEIADFIEDNFELV